MCPLTVVWLAGFIVSAWVRSFSLHPVGRAVGLLLAVGRVAALWIVLFVRRRVWLWLLGIRAWR